MYWQPRNCISLWIIVSRISNLLLVWYTSCYIITISCILKAFYHRPIPCVVIKKSSLSWTMENRLYLKTYIFLINSNNNKEVLSAHLHSVLNARREGIKLPKIQPSLRRLSQLKWCKIRNKGQFAWFIETFIISARWRLIVGLPLLKSSSLVDPLQLLLHQEWSRLIDGIQLPEIAFFILINTKLIISWHWNLNFFYIIFKYGRHSAYWIYFKSFQGIFFLIR